MTLPAEPLAVAAAAAAPAAPPAAAASLRARLRLGWVVAAGGGILMALEILASRVLAPHFGSSVYVWGSIISVFLAALSLGYVWGGRLADREPTLAGLGRHVAWAALAQGVLLLAARPATAWLGELTGGSAWGTLVAATVLFGPPSVLLGVISPYAVRLAAGDLARLGGTAGGLYALSTAGSLLGTLGCTFALVPFLTLDRGLALLLALTAVTALAALAGSLRREPLPALAVAAVVALAVRAWVAPAGPGGGLLFEQMTPYQTLRVSDAGGVRLLESDRIHHSAMRLSDGEPALPYPRAAAAALVLQPEIDSMLVLGMGAGHAGTHLQDRRPGLALDFVDIDPAVPAIAARWFGFRETPARRVHVVDGRRFLDGADRRWDYIYCDTYIGLSVPFHLTTREFLALVRERLEPGGVFGLNLAGSLRRPFPRAIYRTVLEVFPHAWAFAVPASGNFLVLATADGPKPTAEELERRAADLDREYGFELPLSDLVARRLRSGVDFSGTPVLTDRFAPVDRLLHLGLEEAEIPGLPPAASAPADGE
jgi:spermidine synthase